MLNSSEEIEALSRETVIFKGSDSAHDFIGRIILSWVESDKGYALRMSLRDATGWSEVRDIYIVRQINGSWSAPQAIYADNWQINGCPVNGPSVAADGRRVVVAWFTSVGDTPHVKVAFSENAGATFNKPIQLMMVKMWAESIPYYCRMARRWFVGFQEVSKAAKLRCAVFRQTVS